MALGSKVLAAVALVVLAGCAAYRPETVFLPKETDAVYPYFVGGVPYASVETECAGLFVSLQPAVVGANQYMQLFVEYANNGDSRFLLAPLSSLKLAAESKKKTFVPIAPVPPSIILHRIEKEKAGAEVAAAIVGAIQAAAVAPTSVRAPSGTIVVDDRVEKVGSIADQTASRIAEIERLGADYRLTVSESLLRRNTLGPGDSAWGFVYFPFPFRSDPLSVATSGEVKSHAYTLSVETPCGVVEVQFEAAPGE